MNRVFKDINKSDISLGIGNLSFYFSSEFNRKRFLSKSEVYVNEEELKFISKYHVSHYDNLQYLLIAYYLKVEKRGFRIFDKDKNIFYNKLDEIKFKTIIL